jgi:hypothetical protein
MYFDPRIFWTNARAAEQEMTVINTTVGLLCVKIGLNGQES